MNMLARFDENPAMTLRVIKETKRYGRTHGRTDARTDGQRENNIPPTNKVCGGYKNGFRAISFEYSYVLDSYFIHWCIIIKYRSSSITGKIHRLSSELWP